MSGDPAGGEVAQPAHVTIRRLTAGLQETQQGGIPGTHAPPSCTARYITSPSSDKGRKLLLPSCDIEQQKSVDVFRQILPQSAAARRLLGDVPQNLRHRRSPWDLPRDIVCHARRSSFPTAATPRVFVRSPESLDDSSIQPDETPPPQPSVTNGDSFSVPDLASMKRLCCPISSVYSKRSMELCPLACAAKAEA